jgi:hypothetical protein
MKNNDKFGPLFLGIILIIGGAGIIGNPKVHSAIYDYTFDFTGHNVPFGALLFVIGSILVFTSFREK